jgi:hypothetical protein
MLIKSADDKSKRLALLADLQKSPLMDARQKQWLREELMRCRKGIQGEKESAYYLESYFKGSENHVLLHDLRLVVDGDVAQIDHLAINRMGLCYLIETKNYAGDIAVNDYGEFTVTYDEDRFGIPSPLEQSHRHERVLAKLMEQLGMGGRMDTKLEFHHVVMLHPKATIQRPDAKAFDTSFLIKADQFPTWHKKFADGLGVGSLVKAAVNMRSLDSIKEWGEKLKRQHLPQDLLALPDFMKPKAARAVERAVAPAGPVEAAAARLAQPAPVAAAPTPSPVQATADESIAKKLICAHCRGKISYPEGKFCWNNTKRFGGLQYCRDHQGLFS